MLRAGIFGATGYAGEELIKILLKHKHVQISYLAAKVDKPEKIQEIFPHLKTRLGLVCDNPDLRKAVNLCDILFLALPHTASLEIVPVLLKSKKLVIDLSADYRLKDATVYEGWYKAKHTDKLNLNLAVYGLPEFYRENIAKAKLIANPGCYPTAAILALAPLMISSFIDPNSIIIDAKSGVTGAGRKAISDFAFAEVDEDFKAYKVNVHQHSPEINQELSKLLGKKIGVTFVPHLLPLKRGILETIYVKGNDRKRIKGDHLVAFYKKFYRKEAFVRIYDGGDFPQLKNVVETNFCDIGIRFDDKKNQLIIIAAIDNLIKGAAGQAVQNMNIMCGFDEVEGLL